MQEYGPLLDNFSQYNQLPDRVLRHNLPHFVLNAYCIVFLFNIFLNLSRKKMKNHKNLDQEATTKPWAPYTNFTQQAAYTTYNTYVSEQTLETTQDTYMPTLKTPRKKNNARHKCSLFYNSTRPLAHLNSTEFIGHPQQSSTEHNQTTNTEQCHSVNTKHRNIASTDQRHPT